MIITHISPLYLKGTKNRNQKNTNNIPSGTSGGTMSNAFRGGKNKAKKGGGSVHPTERVLKVILILYYTMIYYTIL